MRVACESIESSLVISHKTANKICNLLAEGTGNERVFAAYNTTSTSLLKKLSNDDLWIVREAVAKNSHTPKGVLKNLLNDCDRDVIRAAWLSD